ncbi:alpha/beta hydrolase [Mesorhizobium sp. M0208]|uniref:alpha/beta fold hydrolase n=1 Tax=Mesorhizobium sp. M0208 TaxID=2956916 RepID=UPI00333D9D87
MSRHLIVRDNAVLSGVDEGSGPAVIFQHGLGASDLQVAEVFPLLPGYRRLTLECRGHGRSEPGPSDGFAIAVFAQDVLAFADSRGIEQFAVGGISMGAAIALRIAVVAPRRVRALVLARPAWLWDPAPPNLRFYVEAAQMLQDLGREAGRRAFERSPSARFLVDGSPDNVASLLSFFAPHRPSWTASLLASVALDGPGLSKAQVAGINAPTLVVGHQRDIAHPLSHARELAGLIRRSELLEVTPKSDDRASHIREVSAGVVSFLSRHLRSVPEGALQ